MSYTKRINKILRKVGGGTPSNLAYEYDHLASQDQARDQLILLGAEAIEDMLSVFKTANYGHRSVIIRTLVKIGDAKAVTSLESLLQDAEVSKDSKEEIARELRLLKLKS